MKNNFLKVFFVFFFSFVFSFSVAFVFASETNGTISISNGKAVVLTEGLGNLYFNTTNGEVHVTDAGLSGYAWGDVIGWVNLNPNGGGVANDAEGNLSGYAWGEQSGWINFAPTNGGVTIDEDGVFSGYAWAESAGWISFNCDDEEACGDDNYYVETDWRPESVRGDENNNPGGSSGGSNPPVQNPPTPETNPDPTPDQPETGITPDTDPEFVPPGEGEDGPEFIGDVEGGNPDSGSTASTGSGGGGTRETINQIIETANQVREDVVDFIQSEEGDVISKIVTTTGAVTVAALTVTSAALFANPLAIGEIVLIPTRFITLFSTVFGLRRRERPWGIVYDAVTKQPLDPVYVTLKDQFGKEVASSITDLDGRFGFFVPRGIYFLSAQKVHYGFPSQKLQGHAQDAIYKDLYHGEPIEVTTEGEVISKNIPMDPEGFDWNEFAKTKMKVLKFNPRREALVMRISNFLFSIGFIVAAVATVFSPEPYNLVVAGVYVVLLVLRVVGIKPKKHGVVSEISTRSPLSFAAVSIYSNALQAELFKKIADKDGRYYALVPKGKYEITVSKKDELNGENYIEVTKKPFFAKNGVINLDLAV